MKTNQETTKREKIYPLNTEHNKNKKNETLLITKCLSKLFYMSLQNPWETDPLCRTLRHHVIDLVLKI